MWWENIWYHEVCTDAADHACWLRRNVDKIECKNETNEGSKKHLTHTRKAYVVVALNDTIRFVEVSEFIFIFCFSISLFRLSVHRSWLLQLLFMVFALWFAVKNGRKRERQIRPVRFIYVWMRFRSNNSASLTTTAIRTHYTARTCATLWRSVAGCTTIRICVRVRMSF